MSLYNFPDHPQMTPPEPVRIDTVMWCNYDHYVRVQRYKESQEEILICTRT